MHGRCKQRGIRPKEIEPGRFITPLPLQTLDRFNVQHRPRFQQRIHRPRVPRGLDIGFGGRGCAELVRCCPKTIQQRLNPGLKFGICVALGFGAETVALEILFSNGVQSRSSAGMAVRVAACGNFLLSPGDRLVTPKQNPVPETTGPQATVYVQPASVISPAQFQLAVPVIVVGGHPAIAGLMPSVLDHRPKLLLRLALSAVSGCRGSAPADASFAVVQSAESGWQIADQSVVECIPHPAVVESSGRALRTAPDTFGRDDGCGEADG